MKPDYILYLVTDRRAMSTRTLAEAVEQAIAGGCTMVQLREAETSALEFYQLAVDIKAVTDRHHIPLIINNRIDIALAIRAAGVHLGQNDIPTARRPPHHRPQYAPGHLRHHHRPSPESPGRGRRLPWRRRHVSHKNQTGRLYRFYGRAPQHPLRRFPPHRSHRRHHPCQRTTVPRRPRRWTGRSIRHLIKT